VITPFLRNGAWLTQERVVAYSWMAVTLYALAAAVVVLTSDGVLDAMGRPLGTDFAGVWKRGSTR